MSEPSPAAPTSNRWILALLASACLMVIVWLLRDVLLPFAIAGALAYIAGPAVRWIHRRLRWPRWVGAVIVFIVILCILAGITFGVERVVLPQVRSILADLPEMLRQFLTKLFRGNKIDFMGQVRNVDDIIQQLQLTADQYARNTHDLLATVGIGVAAVMGVVLTVVLLFYFLVDGPRLSAGVLWLVPPPIRDAARTVARRAGPIINRYIIGVFVVVIYASAVTWIVTQWILGLPHAIVLALAVGILELIPVIGPILSLMLIALAAITHAHFWMIVGLALFAIGLRLSIDQLVGPIVLGKAVSLSPPIIIFAFLAGGVIYGTLGVLVAIPVAAIVKIILEEAYRQSEPGKESPPLPAGA
jgi:predicted PurR-regulated permease PerM